ncbi:Golgi transport complex subunit 4 [Coemansia sp. RSA 1813]|nr:Golgi transport complex subunit 4 [Coemansia sp. RSA 1646]KAJ1766558.1 Golgi transport complex subunit 4 [Coemansia sp. RSA 1843]KAJ2090977.1 Golgi transport complex subunit 4 [Coemansia sp. RSA 986]KAJ2215132.1 Golgi transport complex subunit 4 [Coemansia sp. RSA 487]KAJ2563292.1 Golgi transport complex subunit 4 [Coemansia sp. RSA 1813]
MATEAPASAASGLDLDASGEISWTKFENLTQSLDIAEIEQAYRLLELEEARVDIEISEGVERSDEVNARFAQLSDLRGSLAGISELLAPAQAAVDATATNAGALSARVRFLDQELTKLEDAVKMAADTDLLKQRLSELLVAMQDKDFDVAAALVHKYITTDSATLDNPFVSFAQPPSNAPALTDAASTTTQSSSPARIVAEASKELTERVSYMFGTAVETNNTKEISRCFRLFPLLGEETRGLDMYSEFLCSVIAEKSRITGDIQTNIHALRVTRIFEVIATVIDNHFPLVETHYGPGRMIRVMQRLQMEGAKRAAMVLDFFEEDRQIKRRLAQIQQADVLSRQLPTFGDRGRTGQHSEDDISDNDFKEITSILAELVLVERQIAAFNRFMESRAMPEIQALVSELDAEERIFMPADAVASLVPLSMQSAFGAFTAKSNTARVLFDKRTGLISSTPLSLRLVWLTETYVSFETFFLTKSVTKAMLLDDTESLVGWAYPLQENADSGLAKSSAPVSGLSGDKGKGWLGKHMSLDMPQTSSCVGDVFFVVRTSLEHAIATQQASAVEAVVQHTIGTVNSVFLSALEASALKRWGSVGGGSSQALQLGITPGESSSWRLPGVRARASSTGSEKQTAASTQITPYASAQREILVALNNLDLACTYMQKTVETLSSKLDSEWRRVPDQNDVTRAQNAIDTLSALSAKFSHSKQRSLEQIGLQVFKPWVRTILQQSYRDIKYVLTDEEFNDMQNDNLFQKRFMLKFGSLARQLKQRLSAHNLSAALENAIASLSGDWERAIRQSKFNMLGGIMVEKDVREIQRYLEKETGAGLRRRFARLVQMADVLAVENMADVSHILESQSVVDMTAGSQMPPPLSKSDIIALLANRIDISEKDIPNLNT